MRTAFLASAVVGFFFAACGGAGGADGGSACGPTGGGSTTGATGQNLGAINGKALVVGSSAAQRTAYTPYGKGPSQSLVVRLNEDGASCDPGRPLGTVRPGSRLVDLVVLQSADAGTVGTGAFTGSVTIMALPAGSCDAGSPSSSGYYGPGLLSLQTVDGDHQASITFDSVSPTVHGHFKANLSSGATLEGTFDAPYCSFWDWERSALVQCVQP